MEPDWQLYYSLNTHFPLALFAGQLSLNYMVLPFVVEAPYVFTKELNTLCLYKGIQHPFMSKKYRSILLRFPGFWLGSVGFMVVHTQWDNEFTG